MAEHRKEVRAVSPERFQAAWDAGRLDDAAKLSRVLANDLAGGCGARLTEERAAKLALKPTRTLKEFMVLCANETTVKTLLTSSLPMAETHPTLALNMSRLLASIPHFPKPTETLVKCGALGFLTEFLGTLPSFIDRATKVPYQIPRISVARNLILTAILLKESQDGFGAQLLRAGVLEALLDSKPLRDGQSSVSDLQWLGLSILEFVAAAVFLCTDLSYAKRIYKGEAAELCPRVVGWAESLLRLSCAVLEVTGDGDQFGTLPQASVDGLLGLLHLVAEGASRGEFDFRPSIRLAAPHLDRFPGDRTQSRLVIEGLERASRGEPGSVEPRALSVQEYPQLGFMTFGLMQGAFASSFVKAQITALAELVTFFQRRGTEANYRQADLHARASLFPLAPPILALLEARSESELERAGDLLTTALYVLSVLVQTEAARQGDPSELPPEAEQLEEVGLRLLTWLKLHHSAVHGRPLLFLTLTTVGQCARATWGSLAAILNAGGFLVFCKEWFEGIAQRETVEETEDFAECILTPLRAPRGARAVAAQNAVKEALTRDGMLTWVFERAAREVGFNIGKRPNLLPLLALCSEVELDFSAFLTPEQFRLFVRQLVRNWRGFPLVILPTFEKEDVVVRSMGVELDRLAGHVHIVEAVLCGSRRGAGGKWDPGYLADVRAAVARAAHRPAAATFMTFCEAGGVAVLASMVEEQKRLERFRVRAQREGHSLPAAADVARRVEAVWELAANAFSLHKCANQACSRVEDRNGIFMRCGRCRSARYCSRECQKAHWIGGHKRQCQLKVLA